MKMLMPLVAAEDGVPTFVKQPGVSLEPGDVIGILELDDPSRVKHAKPFEGQLPALGPPTVLGSKPHQVLAWHLAILNNILDGFDNQAIMNTTLKELLEVLRSPDLPYAQVGAILATLSGRMPAKLEEQIRSAIDKAKSGGQEFPAPRVKKYLDAYLSELKPQDRTMARASMGPLIDAVDAFRSGLKIHEWMTIASLLSRYEQTEKLFGGDIEQRVLKLRDEHKDDLDKVAQLVLSHTKAPSKNKLVLSLLDIVKAGGSAALNPETKLTEVLSGLAILESRYVCYRSFLDDWLTTSDHQTQCLSRLEKFSSYAKCPHMKNEQYKWKLFCDNPQALPIMANSRAVKGMLYDFCVKYRAKNKPREPNMEVLKELTDSRWVVYDVLPTFFSHSDANVCRGTWKWSIDQEYG